MLTTITRPFPYREIDQIKPRIEEFDPRLLFLPLLALLFNVNMLSQPGKRAITHQLC